MPLSLFRPDDGPAESPALTVSDVLAAYQRHCAVEKVHGDEVAADRKHVFGLFLAAYGQLAVADCRPFHLTDFIESNPKWRAVGTRRGKANAIRAAFNWAAEQERIDRNPFRSVRYGEDERRPEMPDNALDRVSRLANKPYETALTFLRLTACRLSELCRATWADVDLDRGVWIIPQHKGRKFTRRRKEIALVRDAVDLLRSMVRGEGLIFRNTRGTAWTRRTLGQQLTRMLKRHQIETQARLHGIRHRALTAMIENGAPIKLVAEQAGHSSTAVTEKYYWHRTDAQIELIRAAAERGVPKK